LTSHLFILHAYRCRLLKKVFNKEKLRTCFWAYVAYEQLITVHYTVLVVSIRSNISVLL